MYPERKRKKKKKKSRGNPDCLYYFFFSLFLLQRATLAEKEVNALKEQLTTAKNQAKSESGEQQLLSNKMADCEQQTLEIISRNNIEGELASKDKEVNFYHFFFLRYESTKRT